MSIDYRTNSLYKKGRVTIASYLVNSLYLGTEYIKNLTEIYDKNEAAISIWFEWFSSKCMQLFEFFILSSLPPTDKKIYLRNIQLFVVEIYFSGAKIYVEYEYIPYL